MKLPFNSRDRGESASRFEDREIGNRILSLPTLLVIAIAIAVIGLLMWRVLDFEWQEFFDNVTGLDVRSFLLAGVLYYASFWFRGLRWRSIYKTVISRQEGSTRDVPDAPSTLAMASLIFAGWFVNSIMFFRLGDAYRGWALANRSGDQFSVTLGTVFAERVQDMAVVLILIIISAALALSADGFSASGALVDAGVVVIGVAAALVLVLFIIIAVMGTLGKRLAKLLPIRVRKPYLGFQSGTLHSFRGRELPLQITLGICGWILEVGRFYFVAEALGLEMALSIAMFATLANAILTTIPIPGGLGIVETALVGLLLLTGLNDTDAFTLTVLDRSISWLSIVVLGGVVFAFISLRGNSRRARQPESETGEFR